MGTVTGRRMAWAVAGRNRSSSSNSRVQRRSTAGTTAVTSAVVVVVATVWYLPRSSEANPSLHRCRVCSNRGSGEYDATSRINWRASRSVSLLFRLGNKLREEAAATASCASFAMRSFLLLLE